MQGYCLKCREKREMQEPKEVTLKNGRAAMQGLCSVCGTKITVIGGKKAAEKIGDSDKSDNFAKVDTDSDSTPKGKRDAEGRDPVTAKIKAETKDKAKAAKK
ncbi:MAG: hypothetical protein AVDCRST_MAG18-2274 [uncultured Thermomicrobiales bacterium]|uniref:DUF5679 domain-containing protein n=1 Tax=uncultured Thermomicrobiales bacterium TaxID=1645740 RepID=A0A6J4VEZ9_9BACT|nr:MAG: hypothetical protein AVDCRST_MAG18-2274 [uncultured Thermomicrobiales bacterium]